MWNADGEEAAVYGRIGGLGQEPIMRIHSAGKTSFCWDAVGGKQGGERALRDQCISAVSCMPQKSGVSSPLCCELATAGLMHSVLYPGNVEETDGLVQSALKKQRPLLRQYVNTTELCCGQMKSCCYTSPKAAARETPQGVPPCCCSYNVTSGAFQAC